MDVIQAHKIQKVVVFHLLFLLIICGAWGSDYIDSASQQVDNDHLDAGGYRANSQKFVGCWPCFQEYLSGSYFSHKNNLLDSEFDGFLAEEFSLNNQCSEPADNLIASSELQLNLSGGGSHRHLISTLRFGIKPDAKSWFSTQYCQVVIAARLPTGVFADPFELQHLVHSKIFNDAAVFGDANLELPSALSNKSIVEIHLAISIDASRWHHITVTKLPLHARYPPLDSSGYAMVEVGQPDFFLRCRPKDFQPEPCSWMLMRLSAEAANSVKWLIPSGNEAHKEFVSSITFFSALICALAIVATAIQSKVLVDH